MGGHMRRRLHAPMGTYSMLRAAYGVSAAPIASSCKEPRGERAPGARCGGGARSRAGG